MSDGQGPATYADLLRAAARHTARAAQSLTTTPLRDREAALSAIAWRAHMLADCGVHLRSLVDASGTVDAAGPGRECPDRQAAALARALLCVGPVESLAAAASGPARSWRSAAVALGAAADLIATHRDRRGEDRSPDAQAPADPAGRSWAYATVADLVGALALAERDLALRVAQTGMPWREVERRLPDLDQVDLARRLLRQEAAWPATRDPHPALAALTVARPRAAATTAVGPALVAAVARLRLGAWSLARHPARASAADLVEYAAAAVVLHTHLAAHAEAAGDPGLAATWGEARAAWAQQHRHVARFASTQPTSAALRAEVAALPGRAQLALPITRTRDGVRTAGRPSLGSVDLVALSSVCGELAATNSTVLHTLAQRGSLFIDGRYLAGDHVTDSVALVEAKLHGHYVAAHPEDAASALHAYAALTVGTAVRVTAAPALQRTGAAPARLLGDLAR